MLNRFCAPSNDTACLSLPQLHRSRTIRPSSPAVRHRSSAPPVTDTMYRWSWPLAGLPHDVMEKTLEPSMLYDVGWQGLWNSTGAPNLRCGAARQNVCRSTTIAMTV